MKLSLFVFAASGLAALAGCRTLPEPVCESTLLVASRVVSGPRTVTLGQTASYQLTYNVGDNCGQLARLLTKTVDSLGTTGRTLRQVAIQARYSGCTCAVDTVTVAQTTYQFQPWRKGTFVLQFLTRNSQFITDTLTVR